MRAITTTIAGAVLFLCVGKMFAQHIPPCQGFAHPGYTVCWGYATGRAFNRSWNDARCAVSTLYLDLNTLRYSGYFQRITPFDLNSILPGDIIEFQDGGHVSYVSAINSRDIDGVRVDQVEDEQSAIEQKDLRLSWVISGHNYPPVVRQWGWPTAYYRKKALWSVSVQNDFTGGQVGVNGVEYDSPKTVGPLNRESVLTIEAVMDGRHHNGCLQQFQEWQKESQSTTLPKVAAIPPLL